LVGVEAYTERSEDDEEKKRVRVKEEREEQEGKIDKEGGRESGRDPFPLEMGVFRAHLVRRRRNRMLEEEVKEAQENVGGGEWDAVGGERGVAERLDGSKGLDPKKEGGGPTGKSVGDGICLIRVRPGDGFYPLHEGDGRTEKEESGVQLLVDADEDSERTKCERLERDGGVPTHVVSEEVCFCLIRYIASSILIFNVMGSFVISANAFLIFSRRVELSASDLGVIGQELPNSVRFRIGNPMMLFLVLY
jgi:hypothetical protein